MSIKINTNSVQPKDPWLGVNGRLWRHTVGRVSNVVRVPINLFGALCQAGKVIVKTVALPITYTVIGIRSLVTKESVKAYRGDMSIPEIAFNAVVLVGLLNRAAVCFKNAIIAPSRKNKSFLKEVSRTWKIVEGNFHDDLVKIFEKKVLVRKLSSSNVR